MVIYDNAIEFIKDPKKYYLNILCPDYVMTEINKILRHDKIWIKFYGPTEAIIEMHSKKALIFFADYFENKFVMTFCSYPDRNDNCFFCGQESYIKFTWDKFKNPIFLCCSCDSKIHKLIR